MQGAIAQLGERMNGIHEVGGSIPPGSIIKTPLSLIFNKHLHVPTQKLFILNVTLCFLHLRSVGGKSNIINMEIRHIDFENRIITVPGREHKNKKMITIPVDKFFINEIKEYIEKNNIASKLFKTKDFRASYSNALKHAGLPQMRIHDLRHSVGTNIIKQDISAYKVKNLLGHSGFQMTQRYVHMANEELRDEMEEYQNGISANNDDDK